MEVCNLLERAKRSLQAGEGRGNGWSSHGRRRGIDRRSVAVAAFAAGGPAILHGGDAKAQARAGRASALFGYVGAFTTPERASSPASRFRPLLRFTGEQRAATLAVPIFEKISRARRGGRAVIDVAQ